MPIHALTIFGTRPEAIKMAPLVKRLEADPNFTSTVCVTAQHRQMLDQVLDLFGIAPDLDLDVMRPDQDLYDLTARILPKVRDVLQQTRPDILFVQGDTTTTFAAALGAFYAGVPVGHVEAGLRTWNLRAPFPEEANRTLTTRLAAFHFCPTANNAANLRAEGIRSDAVFVTGNTVIDALLWVRDKVAAHPPQTWAGCWGSAADAVRRDAPLILVTGHRRENFGKGVDAFCRALYELSLNHPDWHMIYPVHLNPNIDGPVRAQLSGRPNIHLIPPLDYAPFVYLMNKARIILTDSGGVQEEAPSLGKPVLVMRETTERPEAADAGAVCLVGTDATKIITEVELLMDDDSAYLAMAKAMNPYGDGQASEKILKIVSEKMTP